VKRRISFSSQLVEEFIIPGNEHGHRSSHKGGVGVGGSGGGGKRSSSSIGNIGSSGSRGGGIGSGSAKKHQQSTKVKKPKNRRFSW
jgi:hypothetical protein